MSFSELPLLRLALCLVFITSLPAAPQQHLIKLATLAPENSNWVKAVRAIDAEVRQQTGGAVGFKIYPGGVQGDEDVMLRKIRVGQLQAAGIGGQGVSQIFPDILALEMPFLFNSYDEIDYVLAQMDQFYKQGYENNGFVLLGWADLGFVYILSQKPVRGAKDVEAAKVWRLEGEPITDVLFRKAGVSSVPLAIPDVLLGLQTNLVEVVYASPTAAIVLQWFTRVKYLTHLPINYTLGVVLIDAKVFGQLSPEHQQVLLQVAWKHMGQMNLQNRQDNEQALQVMLDHGVELVEPPPAEIQTFKQLVEESKPELVGKAFSQESFDLVQKHLAEYRQQHSSGR